MPDDETAELARRIVSAYRASGIPAKIHRGQVFVYRNEEWAGPFDARELQPRYIAEIQRVEQEVRAAVATCVERLLIEDPLCHGLGREEILQLRMSPQLFEREGLNERQVQFYLSVARQLQFQGQL